MKIARSVYLFGLIFMICMVAFSQNAWDTFVKNGNAAFDKDNYKIALRFYKKAVAKGCEDGVLWYRYAHSKEQMEEYDEAYHGLYYKAYELLKEQYPTHEYTNKALDQIFKEGGDPKWYMILSLILGNNSYVLKYLQQIDNVNYYWRLPSYLDCYLERPSLLEYASWYGYYYLVEKLLEKGADPNSMGYYNSNGALYEALVQGHQTIVKLLLDHGADFERRISYEDKDSTPDYPITINTTPVFLAIENENNEALSIMLELGADVDAVKNKQKPSRFYGSQSTKSTLLATAIENGNLEATRMLLEYGADVAVLMGKISLLSIALENGNAEAIKILLECGADPKAQGYYRIGMDEHKISNLELAVKGGSSEAVLIMLDAGADVNDEGRLALKLAAQVGHSEIIQVLVDAGADMNPTETDHFSRSETALMIATKGGHSEAVQVLVDGGADLNVYNYFADRKEGTPLIVAAYNGNVEIMKILVDAGADVNAKDTEGYTEGWTALTYGAESGHSEIVQVLLNAGADVNARDLNLYKKTALMVAASSGHSEIVQLLMDAGADLNAYGYKGGTPFLLAVKAGHSEIVQLLVDAGANVNEKNSIDKTALMFAAEGGNPQIVQILLDAGADLNAKYDLGRYTSYSVLKVAENAGHNKIVEILKKAGAK